MGYKARVLRKRAAYQYPKTGVELKHSSVWNMFSRKL